MTIKHYIESLEQHAADASKKRNGEFLYGYAYGWTIANLKFDLEWLELTEQQMEILAEIVERKKADIEG